MDHGAPVVGTMDALGDRSHLARGRLLDLDVGDDSPLGGLVVIADGAKDRVDAAVDYLRSRNIGIEVLAS